MALVALQTIFHDAFPAYAQAHPLPAHVRKAARAIMPCRTAALGGHVHACPAGHVSRIWYNACRHRSCPPCASLQTERWLALQQARLLACDHYHVLFTLPHDLNPLWLAHVSVMTSLLFQAMRETLCALLLADPQYLGALFADKETILPPAFGVTEPTPVADAGFHIFNGDDTGTDAVTFRMNGVTVLENEVVPISYTVNADCTGSYTVLVPGGPSFDLFIAPNGEAIATIATDPPGNCGSSIDRRVSPK